LSSPEKQDPVEGKSTGKIYIATRRAPNIYLSIYRTFALRKCCCCCTNNDKRHWQLATADCRQLNACRQQEERGSERGSERGPRQVEAVRQGITNIMARINAVENTASDWGKHTHDRRVMQTK